MRVLHVTRDFPPRVNGGLSTAVGTMVRTVARFGISQAVVSFDGYRPRSRRGEAGVATVQWESGLPVLRLERPGQLTDAASFAREFGPAMVHVHQAMLWDFGAEVAAGAPRIFSLHLLQGLLREMRGQLEATRSERDQARALDEADLVIVPSEACLERLRPEHRARAVQLPLGVEDSPAARAAVGRPRPAATFLYAGRFGDVKGTQQLLEAIPGVQEALPDAQFIVAGGLPDNPKADRRWRRRFADRAPRAELVGWCSTEQLSELFARATIFVAPSWFETFGLSVIEAMLHGLPVVACEAGHLAELVEPGRTGWLVPPRDVEALTARLVTAARSDDPAAMGRRAAEQVRRRYLSSQRAPELIAAYRRVLAHHDGGHRGAAP